MSFSKSEIEQISYRAHEIHSLGGFSMQSTANGWFIMLLQSMKDLIEKIDILNGNLTKMRYKVNEHSRLLNDISNFLANIDYNVQHGDNNQYKRLDKLDKSEE